MSDPSSALTGVVIGLVSSFGSILLIGLVVFVFWASGCAGSGRILLDRLGRPGEYDDEQAFLREEEDALETMDEMARTEYLRAKGKTARCLLAMPTSSCNLIQNYTNASTSLCHRQPARVPPNRHFPLPVPRYPGKGRLRLGI